MRLAYFIVSAFVGCLVGPEVSWLGAQHPEGDSLRFTQSGVEGGVKDTDVALARFRRAMNIGTPESGLTVTAPNSTPTVNDAAWDAMARAGHPLTWACAPMPRVKRDVPKTELDTQTLCAQLVTAYVVTGDPGQVSRLVALLKSRWHLRDDSEVQHWYARQLANWFQSDSAAVLMANVLLGHSSTAATIQHSLLLQAARLLTRSTPGLQVYASLPTPTVWPSEPPAPPPFEPSKSLTGIEFSGAFRNYGRADWWYTSWGTDNRLYTIFAGGILDDSAGNAVGTQAHVPDNASTGRAVILGDDPLHLTLTPLPSVSTTSLPFTGGRWPSATLMYHGVWYAGTYTLQTMDGCPDFCAMGPTVGFHWSTDKGRTWHTPPATVTPASPLFPEAVRSVEDISAGARVKLGQGHFVDFGKDMRYSPDGKAYLIGHGSTDRNADVTWAAGDQIYLARVTPSPEAINDVRAWEFYAGSDARGQPHWSKDFSDIRPLLDWKGHLGSVTVTYDAPLKKYLLFSTRKDTDVLTGRFDTMVLEADQLTGPWRLVTYMKEFGPQAYSVSLPSKFISPDGCTMWLSYAANFSFAQSPGNPFGSGYWMHLHKVRLLGPGRCRKR